MSRPVTAIVLNWCAEADTAACLESLGESSYDALSILLVDNGSPDGSGERLRLRFPDVGYLQTGKNLGYAGGNNAGFDWALARGAEYLLVLNDDTVIDRDCVSRLVAAAEETEAHVAAPQIRYYDEPDRVWYGGGRFSVGRGMGMHEHENEPVDRTDRRRPITFACGCCFLIRGDVLRTVGGFDESFFAYVEDAELSLRLVRRGYRITYEPQAVVQHRIKRNARETPFQIRQRDRNRRRMVAKHYRWWERLQFAAWFYPTRAVHLANFVVRGNWSCAGAIVEGTLGKL